MSRSITTADGERRSQRGQALAVVTLSFVAILAMTALIIDGGNAWAQQRITQNGTDAAAEAGAVVLGQRAGQTPADPLITPAAWDALVLGRINAIATANGITVSASYYTDICGQLLKGDGTAALDLGSAAQVGSGLPTGTGPTPSSCQPLPPVGPVAGIRVLAAHSFSTYLAGIVGIHGITASATATAVEGRLEGCSATAVTGCAVIPMALPPYLTYCDNNGKAVTDGQTDYPLNTRIVIPICRTGPGNFGWLDWDSNGNHGTPGLVNCIQNPCNPAFTLAAWLQIAEPGFHGSPAVEDAFNSHIGEVIVIPMFDGMCAGTPDLAQSGGAAPFGCPDNPPYDLNSGMNGNASWYHLFEVAGFKLEHAYTHGNNTGDCNPDWSPTGGSSDCIIGTFTNLVTSGTVGAGSGPVTGPGLQAVGVQLIK